MDLGFFCSTFVRGSSFAAWLMRFLTKAFLTSSDPDSLKPNSSISLATFFILTPVCEKAIGSMEGFPRSRYETKTDKKFIKALGTADSFVSRLE